MTSEDVMGAGVSPREPQFVPIFEALDNAEARMNFMKMLGFEPETDDKGNIIYWVEVKEPDYKDILMATLTLMSSKKVMGVANIEDVEPLSGLEVEVYTDLLMELIELLVPPDKDFLPYIPATVWAKLEMKKALTLADNGMLVKSLLGTPVLPRTNESAPVVPKPEKRGFLDKLLGRD